MNISDNVELRRCVQPKPNLIARLENTQTGSLFLDLLPGGDLLRFHYIDERDTRLLSLAGAMAKAEKQGASFLMDVAKCGAYLAAAGFVYEISRAVQYGPLQPVKDILRIFISD